jgi:lipid-binding SYLF domain-containing protein
VLPLERILRPATIRLSGNKDENPRRVISGGEMRKTMSLFMIVAMVAIPVLAADDKPTDKTEEARLAKCAKVFDEIMGVPETAPRFTMDRADCVIIMPGVIKGNAWILSLGFGGSFGRGAMSCRTGEHFDGPWGAPTMVALEGMNWSPLMAGGGEVMDILIFVMNAGGAKSVLLTKAKIGGDASATAGSVGRDVAAEEDAALHSTLLTFARAKGLFAGIALTGSTLRADGPANTKVYGKKVNAQNVVLHGAEPVPDSAKALVEALNNWSPKNLSSQKDK